MRNIRRNSFTLGAILLLACASLFAHHGTNVSYQGDKLITVKGVVTEFSFSYPHVSLTFDVKNEQGNIEHWSSELGPTPIMMRNMGVGWNRNSIKPGDQVTLTCNPSKIPSAKVCLGKKLVINGKEMPLRDAAAPGGRGEGDQ